MAKVFSVLSEDDLLLAAPLSIVYISEAASGKAARQGILRIQGESTLFHANYSTLHPGLAKAEGVFIPEWMRAAHQVGASVQVEYLEAAPVEAAKVVLRPLLPLPRPFVPPVSLVGLDVVQGMPVLVRSGAANCYFSVEPTLDPGQAYQIVPATEVEYRQCADEPPARFDIIDAVYRESVQGFVAGVRAAQLHAGAETAVHLVCAADERVFGPFHRALLAESGAARALTVDLHGLAVDDEIVQGDRVGAHVERLMGAIKGERLLHIPYASRLASDEAVKGLHDLIVRVHHECPGVRHILMTDMGPPGRLLRGLARQPGIRVLEHLVAPLSHSQRRAYLQHRLGSAAPIDELQWRLSGLELGDLDRLAAQAGPDPTRAGLLAALGTAGLRNGLPYVRLMGRGLCSWEALRGYARAKRKVQDALYGPWRDAERHAALGIASVPGILLHGPAGCGKTSFVRAVADDGVFSVLELDMALVRSRYLGETEERLRRCFELARQSAPCILFIDQIDVLGRRRALGAAGGGTGAEERLLSTLLNEMDGIEGRRGVTVIGCSSRPEALDAALKRPGRLELHVELALPDAEERRALAQHWLANLGLGGAEDIAGRLAAATAGASCAAVVQRCQVAGRHAVRRGRAPAAADLWPVAGRQD